MGELPSIRETWDFQDPAKSERLFAELVPRAEADGVRAYALELRTQSARAMGLQGRFDDAHAELDIVEAALEDGDSVPRLRLLLERGRAFRSSGDPDAARPLFEEAWDLGRAIPHPDLAVDAAHMVALVVPPEDKESWNRRGLEYAESSDDPEAIRWLGSLYNNMGWDAHDAGDYTEALRLHQLGWDWQMEHGTGWGQRVAKWSVAKQMRHVGRAEEAMRLQLELLDEYSEEEPGGEGFVHEELAELLLLSDGEDAARPHFATAHELLKDIDWIEPDRLERIERLGQPASI